MNLQALDYDSVEASAIRCFSAAFPVTAEKEQKFREEYDSYADYCRNCGV